MPQGIETTRAPQVVRLSVRGYKAFRATTTIRLGRITLLLGRNNAGKTALCFAPIFFSHALQQDVERPFPLAPWRGIDFGNLSSIIHQGSAAGFSGRLDLAEAEGVAAVTIGATGPVKGTGKSIKPIIYQIAVERTDGSLVEQETVSWADARAVLASSPLLRRVPDTIHVLRRDRPPPDRYPRYLEYTPASVGPFGEHAPMILAAAGRPGLDQVNAWFEPLGVQIRLDMRRHRRSGDFEILAVGGHGDAISIVDSGAGLAHVLALVVAVRLGAASPMLLCLEHPEHQLHPGAHAAVAELLLDSLTQRPGIRLLVETNSDVLLMRLRRALVEGRLAPDDLRVYFLDEDPTGGSRAREIVLNERGIPDWWPRGVFTESQGEYFAMRRELARRKKYE